MKANLELNRCPYCKGTGHVHPSPSVRIKLLREQNEETQEEFAGKVGVSRTQIANLETARSAPSIELLIRIADSYGVSVDWILGRQT